jgi:translation initiation factor 2 beta subunit (eIF-2beta)/eIF-5
MSNDLEKAVIDGEFIDTIYHLRNKEDFVRCDACGEMVDELDTQLVYKTKDVYDIVCSACIKEDEEIVCTYYDEVKDDE